MHEYKKNFEKGLKGRHLQPSKSYPSFFLHSFFIYCHSLHFFTLSKQLINKEIAGSVKSDSKLFLKKSWYYIQKKGISVGIYKRKYNSYFHIEKRNYS